MEILIVIGLVVGLLLFPYLRNYFSARMHHADPKTAREMLVLARVRQIKYFYIHAGIFAIMMLGVALILFIISESRRDVLLLGMGWAILLAIHAFWVFGINGVLHNWEKRRIKDLLNQIDE